MLTSALRILPFPTGELPYTCIQINSFVRPHKAMMQFGISSPKSFDILDAYWKTVDGGKYLSRYSDGRVNESISETGRISSAKLKKYLAVDPYTSEKADSLFFTFSPPDFGI